jgi:hypothetical protein
MNLKLLAAAGSLALALPVFAGPVNNVFSPIVEKGEVEVELRGVNERDNGKTEEQVTKFDVGYGITSRWFSEIEFEWEKEAGGDRELEEIAVENIFQLTEQGQYFADFGLFLGYADKRTEDAHEWKLGPIVQMNVGQWTATGNFFFARESGDDVAKSEWENSNALNIKYRFNSVEPGIEYYEGDVGDGVVERFIGPSVYGLNRIGKTKLKWQLAYVFGINDDTPDSALRWKLEFEF